MPRWIARMVLLVGAGMFVSADDGGIGWCEPLIVVAGALLLAGVLHTARERHGPRAEGLVVLSAAGALLLSGELPAAVVAAVLLVIARHSVHDLGGPAITAARDGGARDGDDVAG